MSPKHQVVSNELLLNLTSHPACAVPPIFFPVVWNRTFGSGIFRRRRHSYALHNRVAEPGSGAKLEARPRSGYSSPRPRRSRNCVERCGSEVLQRCPESTRNASGGSSVGARSRAPESGMPVPVTRHSLFRNTEEYASAKRVRQRFPGTSRSAGHCHATIYSSRTSRDLEDKHLFPHRS